ncbi:MAG: hypothetical protein R2991_15915 [Thermoanaerobaculia bacterium]
MTWGFRRLPDCPDVRQSGLLYLVLLTVLLVGSLASRALLMTALFLYVIVDPGYLLFFNSFYADGTLFLSLLGVVLALDRLCGEAATSPDGRGRRRPGLPSSSLRRSRRDQ